ncbi:MAG: rhodanese-like domain-containing protein [Hyphomicrobium sp.]|nr:rhodanese-like domain-containing protein [Hyphomicrobium sp.]
MHAGVDDVSVRDAWQRLQSDSQSILIDVRSRAEWSFVGVPDLAAIGKRVVLLEWQTYPDGRIDPEFPTRLDQLLDGSGAGKDTELFFICRSGARSRMAAEAMAAEGYTRCHNIAEGFEGTLDAHRQRGKVEGWKAEGYPWVQS